MATRRTFQNALKWAYFGSWGDKGFSALFAIVFAGILGPRDFGIVSIALIYISFLQMFLDQGLATALIQRKNLEQEHMDAVFWVNLGLSLVLVLFSIVFSRWWAVRNHAPEVAALIPVLSLCIPIEGLSIVQSTLLIRGMDFKSLTIRLYASTFVSGLIGIGMAVAGFRMWALVGQQIARDISALILLWKLSHWRPRFEFSFRHLRELLGFSMPNFLAKIGIFADGQAGSILLGLFFGPVAVGLYRVAERVMNSVVTMAMASIQSVALPEFSRLQDHPDELRKSVASCVRMSSTVTLPALAGLAVVSTPLMAVVGSNWIPASGALKILCLLGMFVVFAFFTSPLLQALGKSGHVAVLEWSRTLLGIVALVAAGLLVRHQSVTSQIEGIAWARFSTGAILVAPVFLYILLKLSGITVRVLISSIAPSATASVCIVLTVLMVSSSTWLASTNPITQLAIEIPSGGLVGLAVLLILDTHLRLSLKGFFGRSLGRQFAPKELV